MLKMAFVSFAYIGLHHSLYLEIDRGFMFSHLPLCLRRIMCLVTFSVTQSSVHTNLFSYLIYIVLQERNYSCEALLACCPEYAD